MKHLLGKVAHTSVGSDVVLNSGSSVSRSDGSAREVAENVGVRLAEVTAAAEGVGLARTTDVVAAGGDIIGGEELALEAGSLKGCVDVEENVALCEDVTALTDLEGVTAVVVPVVVDGVEDGVGLDLGGTARGLVDVVVLEGDVVLGSVEVESPVLVTVAGGGIVTGAVDVRVGDGNVAGCFGTKDNVLASDVGSLREDVSDLNGDMNAKFVLTVTWSIQTLLVPSRVMASPPQTYSGLISEIWMFWMMTFSAPFTIRRPLPLMIPVLPSPTIDLSEATVIPRVPAAL